MPPAVLDHPDAPLPTHPPTNQLSCPPAFPPLSSTLQQCGKFQLLEDFDGDKRSCRARLEKHNARRRRQREMAHMLKKTGTIDEKASDGGGLCGVMGRAGVSAGVSGLLGRTGLC